MFCSISCSKKHSNPMSNPAIRMKMKQKLREIKHCPIRRGGNGRLLSIPVLALLHALGEGWEAEYAVPTKKRKGIGYPTCYKLDLANAEKKIGIEVNGSSHSTIERKDQDLKKIALLREFGWKIFVVSNSKALELYSTFESPDTLLTLLMES